MSATITRMAESAGTDGLDGKWAEILRTGAYDGENYTPEDLDSMVSEYRKREDGAKAPVALGLPRSQSNPGTDEPIGRIDALRRTGNSVHAKFAVVDPRAEQLHARGAFPKKSVQLKRSPNGLSLQRVGLISPVPDGNHWRYDATPSLDTLMQQSFGSKDHTFTEAVLANQWLELFCSGDYGDKGNFGTADLDQIVRNFDPSFHEAPVVIGHPQHDAPAYAWVDSLKRNGEKLMGKLKEVDPTFAEMVKTGRFKKRSVSLYRTAQGWMLRHVGFLGAQAPEVKGLTNATFGEDRMRCVELIFGEPESRVGAAIAELKDRGFWMERFDRAGVPELLRALDGNPAFKMQIDLLEGLASRQCDPKSVLLSERAEYYARSHGLSFGEALTELGQRGAGSSWGPPSAVVSQAQRAVESDTSDKAVRTGVLSAKLNELAWQRVRSTGATFKQALFEVAAEHPELTGLDTQRLAGDWS